jgi:tetratricopeptide (TPR) repeat protein
VRAPPSAKPKAGKAVDASQSDDRVAKTTAPITLDDAVALADTARANGDLRRAVALLDVVAHQYPHDVRAALAAFTEARILADDLREPRTAAAAFSHALQMGLPASLAEDARARIVETFAAVHDMAAAREAADEYNRRHPNGRFRGLVQRWSGR